MPLKQYSTLLLLFLFAFLPCAKAESAITLPKNAVSVMRISSFAQGLKTYHAVHEPKESDTSTPNCLTDRFRLTPEILTALDDGAAWRIEIADSQPHTSSVLLLQLQDREHALKLLEEDPQPKKREELTNGEIVFTLPSQGSSRNTIWIVTKDWLVLAESLSSAQLVIANWPAANTSSPIHLAGIPNFNTISENTNEAIIVNWWTDPWVQLKNRVKTPHATKDDKKALKYATRHGLLGVRGFSGTASLPLEGPVVANSFALVPSEREHSLQVLTTTPASSLKIPAWLASTTKNLIVFHLDVPQAFQHMDLLFDGMLADGIDGTYRDILEDLKLEEGLNIDLEKALFPHLGPRAYLVNSNNPDHDNPDQPQWLVVFETDDTPAVAKVLRVLMEQDEDVTLIEYPELSAEIWQINSSQEGNRPCLATVHGHAVYASDISLLNEMIASPSKEQREELAGINRQLAQSVVSRTPSPCIAILGNGHSGIAGNDDQRLRDALLTTFFDGSQAVSPSQNKSLTSILERISQTIGNRVVVGVAHEDGWSFSGVNSLPSE